MLLDEVDRADHEFEAFLLEFLSDFTISIPETGTVRARTHPVVVLTSNRTRDLHEALRRRCVYHWIDYPEPALEAEIVLMRASTVARACAEAVVASVGLLRAEPLSKPPGVAETVDFDIYKRGYYSPNEKRNPLGIIPIGPVIDWTAPHGRS